MTSIKVEIPPQPYEVLVGPLLAGIERIISLSGKTRPIIVTEPNIFRLHGATIAEILQAEPIFIAEGEAAKNWQQLQALLESLAGIDPPRNTPIVAVGGGSVGDVAGLAASLFKRGCPIVHIPTTLLAQVDSAVGGKTAIDAFGQKNLIGTFHQPSLVIVDPTLLDTLDGRQMRAGYAEIVKYGLIDDPAFFAWCEANGRGLLAGHPDLRRHAIVESIRAKVRLIAGDVDDRLGKRALLNLGHSFGHAIEAECGFGNVLHGEAVALGMSLAFRFSVDAGLCAKADADRVTRHLAGCELPTRLADVGLANRADRIVKRMAGDKKNMGDRLALILARGIGLSFFEPGVDARRVTDFLERVG